MSKKPFVHLHFHTQYSLLDAACKVKATMERVQDLGMSAIAMTDHGVLYGAIDFYRTARSAGVKPIIGCEVYTTPDDTPMTERIRSEDGSYSNHLVLLAETDEGYHNLVRLASKAQLEGFYYKPRIDKACLREHSKGLIGLSACLKGEIPELCVRGQIDKAVEKAQEFIDILGPDNFFLEMQDHGLPQQTRANEGILTVAELTGLPLVVTNDVHYLNQHDAEAHDCLVCLQTSNLMNDPKRIRYGSDQFYMKSPEEMWKRWGDYPRALENTALIAERCNVELSLGGKELHFPHYVVPDGHTQKGYISHLLQKGLHKRYGLEDLKKPRNEDEKKIANRAMFELGIIEKTNFINYFLVVWDFIRFAKEAGIPVGPGRGSGAGSIVAYALGITGIDPLRYNLIFERFLNPERISPPDFDIDFCQARRDEVIDYVKEKYGRENVAQIITFGTLGAKTVLRDVGRVLEISYSDCDRLAKMIPDDPGMTLEKALKQSPDFKTATETEDTAKRIMKYARTLEGLPRNPGTHAAGVVIGEKPLIEILPLTKDKDGEVVTQFEMKPLEELGLLKMDFLGLKTLTVIQEAVENVRDSRDLELDMEELPLDDEATFDLLNRADTVGVFQVESEGMQDLLRRIGLTRFEDLIAMIALFRPGPMNMLDDYVKRKHNRDKIEYEHPLLEPILRETYGVMLYQEQVQQAANVLAGFSLGEGDVLRRAMGKKVPEIMQRSRKKFVDGCKKTSNISDRLATKIFDTIERFAGYGFNKSHSAAYAMISYQTAYLKSHYPKEFMAAILSSEMGNTDKLPILIRESQKMGIEVLAPNVNEGGVRFRPVAKGIRFGMAGIKNVGVGAVEAMVAEREANGPFEGLIDFCMRLDSRTVTRRAIESLIKCGAFDFTDMSRGHLFAGIDFAMNRASSTQRDLSSGQASFFELLAPESADDSTEDIPYAEPWSANKMLLEEKELLGFYISGHPLADSEWLLAHYNLHQISSLQDCETGTLTRIGGLVSDYAKRFTKKDQRAMATFRLEGLDGDIDVVAFPDPFEEYGVYLKDNAPIMVCGDLEMGDRVSIKAKEVYPLECVPGLFTKTIGIHVSAATVDDEQLQAVRNIVKKYPGDVPVSLCLQFPGGEKVFVKANRDFTATPSFGLLHELEQEIGENTVYFAVDKNPLRKPPRKNGWNGNGRWR
ncbi:MAG: DNA polymerase III subunit alpha [Verrucomicrobia bacterium]|nr:DNA polymerase III subunit alpha [Verrucomicrobiota bacterium]